MSAFSAALFSRLQAAEFYSALHQQAVELLPRGEGRTWLDVGCGPGLVARCAAAHGYRARGVDTDPAMVRRATANARRMGAATQFAVQDLAGAAAGEKADVVSAASLLAVLDDRHNALAMLLACVNPGGTLLIVEPSARMTLRAAQTLRARRPLGRGAWFLYLWAATREPARAVDLQEVNIAGLKKWRHELLDGLVHAWLLRPEAGFRPHGASR